MARNLIVLAVVVGVGAFYLGTIREGLSDGDDYAMYIHHAKNVATGTPYAETGYLRNPHYPDLGPQSYPPGYPLLLAPIYLWRGLDLAAMVRVTIVLFTAFLPIYFLLTRRYLSHSSALLALAATGVCPIFWECKEQITSDLPFLLFLFACLLLLDAHCRRDARRPPPAFHVLGLSVLIWYTSALRSVGVALIPALVLHDLLRYKRVTRFAIQVAIVTGVLVVLQAVLVPGMGGYVERLWPIDADNVRQNAFKYGKAITAVWDNGYSVRLRLMMLAVTGSAALAAYVRRLLTRPTVVETFVPLYVGSLLVFPWSAMRYLFPIVPLYMLYVLVAAQTVTASASRGVRGSVLAVLACAIFTTFGGEYTVVGYGPLETAASRAETEDLYRFVRERTGVADVFVARRPRALSLYTDRSASVYHEAPNDADLWSYLTEIGADYLVAGPEDADHYRVFLARSRDRLRVAYASPRFTVFAVLGAGSARAATSGDPSGR